jgi:hypothetical protein
MCEKSSFERTSLVAEALYSPKRPVLKWIRASFFIEDGTLSIVSSYARQAVKEAVSPSSSDPYSHLWLGWSIGSPWAIFLTPLEKRTLLSESYL